MENENITLLEKLKDICVTQKISLDKEEDLYEIIFNFDIDIDIRLEAVNLYFQKKGDEIIEVITRLNCMYMISNTNNIKQFLKSIALDAKIDDYLKVEIGKCLVYQNNDNFSYDILDKIIRKVNVVIACKVDIILLLMKSKDFEENAIKYFKQIINDSEIDCDYRYKTILSIENKLDNNEKIKYFTMIFQREFVKNDNNLIYYRILSGQYLLRYQKEEKEEIEKYLRKFCLDNNLDHEIRADAADVLLQMGNKESKEIAREIIILLGKSGINIKTVYQNAENVHHKTIEKSALQILQFLNSLTRVRDFEYTVRKIEELILEKLKLKQEEIDEVRIAINRIVIDRSVFGKYNASLKTILRQVWRFIETSLDRDELEKRLIEELKEMVGKCSTGNAYRLVNVLSGFCEYGVTISWEDQIMGNVHGRLNAKIREIEDEEYRDNVLCEMYLSNETDYKLRKNFTKFFRESLPIIKQEMYEEFKDDLSDMDFDLYMRKAVSKYQGHDWS